MPDDRIIRVKSLVADEPVRPASQPAGLITIMGDFGQDRFDLLVVPPGASQASAETALADATDNRHTPELLAGVTQVS